MQNFFGVVHTVSQVTATLRSSFEATVEHDMLSCDPRDDITDTIVEYVATRYAARRPERKVQLTATMDGRTWHGFVHADGTVSSAAAPSDKDDGRVDTLSELVQPDLPWRKSAVIGALAAAVVLAVALGVSMRQNLSPAEDSKPVPTNTGMSVASESVGAGKILANADASVLPVLRKNSLVCVQNEAVSRIAADGSVIWKAKAPANLKSGKLKAGRRFGKEVVYWADKSSITLWDWKTGARSKIALASGESVAGTHELVIVTDVKARFATSQNSLVSVGLPKGARVLLATDSGTLLIAHDSRIKAVTANGVREVPLPVPSPKFEIGEIYAVGETVLVSWKSDGESKLVAHDADRALAIRWVADNVPQVPGSAGNGFGASPDASWVRLGDFAFDIATGARADIEGATVRMTDADLWTEHGHAGRVGEVFERSTGAIPVLSDFSTAVWETKGQWLWAKRKRNPFGDTLPGS